MWTWDNRDKIYRIADTLTPGTAFWLASPVDTTIAVYGAKEEVVNLTYTLYPGWNLIGAPCVPVECSRISELPGVGSDIFGFDASTQSYDRPDFIRPGMGTGSSQPTPLSLNYR